VYHTALAGNPHTVGTDVTPTGSTSPMSTAANDVVPVVDTDTSPVAPDATAFANSEFTESRFSTSTDHGDDREVHPTLYALQAARSCPAAGIVMPGSVFAPAPDPDPPLVNVPTVTASTPLRQ